MTNTVTHEQTTAEQISAHIAMLREDALMVQYPEHTETALFFIEYEVREIRKLLAQ
jgi:hypothetical protein